MIVHQSKLQAFRDMQTYIRILWLLNNVVAYCYYCTISPTVAINGGAAIRLIHSHYLRRKHLSSGTMCTSQCWRPKYQTFQGA